MALTRPVVPPDGSLFLAEAFDFAAGKVARVCCNAAMSARRWTQTVARKPRIDADFVRHALLIGIACWTTEKFSTEYPCHIH
jgi:hypothetical protein